MNFDKHGEPGDFVPTHSGNRLAICNDKGYLLILNVPDLTINTDILLSTQSGYNLATLSFSMDDSLIVTLENWKKFDGNRVRRLSDTVVVYKYNQDYYGGYIDISPDNSKIIFSSLERTILMNARWNPTTVDQEQDPSPMLVYPNPGDDYINIKINNPMSKIINIGVFDENGLLVKEFKKETSDSNEIRFSIENLQQGAYLIRINQDSTNKSYKLIINR